MATNRSFSNMLNEDVRAFPNPRPKKRLPKKGLWDKMRESMDKEHDMHMEDMGKDMKMKMPGMKMRGGY